MTQKQQEWQLQRSYKKAEGILTKLDSDWDKLDLANRGRLIQQALDSGLILKDVVSGLDRSHASVWRALKAASGEAYWKGPNSKSVRKAPGDGRKLRMKAASKKPAPQAVSEVPGPKQGKDRPRESWDVHGDKAEYTTFSEIPVTNLDELIRICKIDLNEWEVERYVCNTWGVTMKPSATTEWVAGKKGHEYPAFTLYDGEPVYRTNYQIKAWLKRKTLVIAAREEINQLIADMRQYAPVYAPFIRTNKLRSGNMLEVGMPDLHLGKYAWAPETGQADWDMDLTVKTGDTALEALMDRSSGHRYDQIVYIVGNDFYNYDNKAIQTTAGTPQSSDTRFPKMFRTGFNMVRGHVDRLTQIAPVRVVCCPGNHDELSAFMLGEMLSVQYQNHPEVVVDNSPQLRKYFQWGKVMLLWTHGDKEKKEDLNGVMSCEQPKMWGDTMFREAHVGHLHKTMVNEKFGMRWRILGALCPADEWHAIHGYIGNLRGAEAFQWNQESGLVGTAVYTVHEAEEDVFKKAA